MDTGTRETSRLWENTGTDVCKSTGDNGWRNRGADVAERGVKARGWIQLWQWQCDPDFFSSLDVTENVVADDSLWS